MKKSIGILLLCIFWVASCRTYYQRYREFNQYFEQGNIKEAGEKLEKNKDRVRKRNRLLYLLNRGVVASMEGDYEESNTYFEEAHIMVEDYQTNYGAEAASFLINPKVTEYRGEDHEKLYIYYYKALNFLKMGEMDKALVECRRMNIRLNELSDKYTNDNKFSKDAFVHLLMGIIYEASGEVNNAFIAYRNAYNAYEEHYSKLFGIKAPEQLKKDLLRTAYQLGFDSELSYYENKFDMEYSGNGNAGDGKIVFFWHNGLGPVKSEWSINFAVSRGSDGMMHFVNQDLGLAFTFSVSKDKYQESGLSQVEFIRVAFPKYVERPPLYSSADLRLKGKEYALEKGENVNGVAFKVLRQRMLKELGKGLLRLALKKAAEYRLRKENENLGALLSVVNAVTEQADTRNWQTLPHSVYYRRLNVEEGKHDVTFIAEPRTQKTAPMKHEFTFDVRKGETIFHTHHTMHTGPYDPDPY